MRDIKWTLLFWVQMSALLPALLLSGIGNLLDYAAEGLLRVQDWAMLKMDRLQ